MPDGEVVQGSFTGDGPIDAVFHAINAATGLDARLREFRVDAVTGGQDALGEVAVVVELGQNAGERIGLPGVLLRERATGAGQAVTTDIIEAAGMRLRARADQRRAQDAFAGRRGGGARHRARRAVIDARALAADAAALVQVPSVTGDERGVLERLAALAVALGLRADLHEHDLAALRAHPDHPGEEAARTELWGLTVERDRHRRGRLAICVHVDVVPEGTVAWRHGPWSGAVEDGWLYGRGSVDMKGAVAAALHALAALARGGGAPAEVVLVAVASEEDGGLGAFAALERDAAFDACLIPEPTGYDVVCAQAGAVTFEGVVPGVAAHAAHRLQGVSAIDRYLPVHRALAEHERALNADVEHPLMRALELPYPLLVGRVEAGEWSSSVPDRLRFEGRAPVRVGEDVAAARAGVEAAVADGLPAGAAVVARRPVRLGRDRSGAPVRGARARRRSTPRLDRDVGLRRRRRGAPTCALDGARRSTVMAGTPGIERAHAVDERVRVDDLVDAGAPIGASRSAGAGIAAGVAAAASPS